MKKKYLLALDGGTGSFRSVLFDFEGNQIAISQEEWEHLPDPRFRGSINFNWESSWSIIARCLKKLFDDSSISPEDIAAISTTSMREGFVAYDSDGSELLAFSNVDARSTKEAIYLKDFHPNLEKEIFNETGESFALGAIPRLLWIKNNEPAIYEKMNTITMINDWISYKLTGELTSEPSNASTTGLFSLSERQWNKELAQRVGIKDSIFPRVVQSGEKIGYVNSVASTLTGLAEGTPVIAGGGDAQLGSLGVGLIEAGQAALFGGSFWQYEYNSDKLPTGEIEKTRINCHAVSDLWQFESIAWNPGLAMRWFRDAFCQEEVRQSKIEGKSVYHLLDQRIGDIPAGCYGMYSLFSNEMDILNLKHASPTFTNFSLDANKFNKYTFYKSIMESASIVTLSHIEQVANLTATKPSELIFAGGSSNNPTWCQIVADVTGLTVKTPIVKEATAIGAAFLAGLGVGIYHSYSEISKLIAWDKEYSPNMENHTIYKKMFHDWKLIYAKQLELSDCGLTQYMWIAPGVK